jgi:ATP-binding cassette subfamily B protein
MGAQHGASSPPSDRQLLVWMFGFVRPVKGLVFRACLYLTLWIGADVLVVRQTALTVNEIQILSESRTPAGQPFFDWMRGAEPGAAGLRRRLLALAPLTAALLALAYLREVSNTRMSMEVVFHIREAVYDDLQHAGFRFHDRFSTGELINRSLSDLQHVRSFLQSAVLVSLEIILIVGGYIALLLTRSPWVAAFAVVPLPLWTWYILRFSRKIQPALQAMLDSSDRNVSLLTENVAGVQVVKAFGTQAQEIEKYNRHCDEYQSKVLARIRMFANFTPVMRSIATASHLTLFLVAGLLILQDRLNAGDLLMLGSAMGAILGRLQQVSAINDQYQHAVVSARRLHEILSTCPTVPEPARPRPFPSGPGAVTFENVTFGYQADKPVLHNVCFQVEGGSVVALVGPTGSGKSTILNLLARYYDPQRGRILVDGTDLRDFSLESLRRRIAPVFQETYLFSEPVEANIAYCRPGIDAGFIEAVSRLAQAHDFVESLPQGYETLIGERGSTLSGGQRQRLAIARALACDPCILILDDATAAVDPETEDLIHRGTRAAMRGRTTILAAHRIGTVERADRVIVLEHGRVTQIGTHRQLLAENGHYRDIAESQLRGDEEAP